MNTIGESAAQGAAGIILWGSLNYSTSKVSVARGTACGDTPFPGRAGL